MSPNFKDTDFSSPVFGSLINKDDPMWCMVCGVYIVWGVVLQIQLGYAIRTCGGERTNTTDWYSLETFLVNEYTDGLGIEVPVYFLTPTGGVRDQEFVLPASPVAV